VKAVKGKNIGIHQGKQLGHHDELNVAKIFLISSLILDFGTSLYSLLIPSDHKILISLITCDNAS